MNHLMKSKLSFRATILTGSVVGLLSAFAPASTLNWDGNATSAPNPNGGTGTWDANTSLNWGDGVTNVVWPALGGTNDGAIFANTAGTVTLATGGITVNDITFGTTGYTSKTTPSR